jgi:hypothetical protein
MTISLGEKKASLLIMRDGLLETGARDAEEHACGDIAQIQPSRGNFRRSQQSFGGPPQVRRAHQVRLGTGSVCRMQVNQENPGTSGDFSEKFRIPRRFEL